MFSVYFLGKFIYLLFEIGGYWFYGRFSPYRIEVKVWLADLLFRSSFYLSSFIRSDPSTKEYLTLICELFSCSPCSGLRLVVSLLFGFISVPFKSVIVYKLTDYHGFPVFQVEAVCCRTWQTILLNTEMKVLEGQDIGNRQSTTCNHRKDPFSILVVKTIPLQITLTVHPMAPLSSDKNSQGLWSRMCKFVIVKFVWVIMTTLDHKMCL